MNKERLIMALDLPDYKSALDFVTDVGDTILFYKIGLELLMTDKYFTLMEDLHDFGKKVFADIKFFDIPETVGRSVSNLSKHEPEFITVHSGSQAILESAVKNKGNSKILAVTVLTSITREDHYFDGFRASWIVEDEVVARAVTALAAGCDGVVASPLEVEILRKEIGQEFIIVCPGIRNNAAISQGNTQDQKRVATVESAFKSGADYIVVGRPIRDAISSRDAAQEFQDQIEQVFSKVS